MSHLPDRLSSQVMPCVMKPLHPLCLSCFTTSLIPDPHTVLEHTGDPLSQFEEGNAAANNKQTATTSP